MNIDCGLKIEPKGDLEIVMTRGFAAGSARCVFRANTEPELLKRWLGVRKGWLLAICEVDLQVGGRYRYLWRNEAKGKEMASGGVFREIVRPERIVCTERFDDPWYGRKPGNDGVRGERIGDSDDDDDAVGFKADSGHGAAVRNGDGRGRELRAVRGGAGGWNMKQTGRSVLAVGAGLVAVVVLSIGTDEGMRAAGVFPPTLQPMTAGLFGLATAYRLAFAVLGSYIAAKMAPNRSMMHGMILGAIGFVLSFAGVVMAWNQSAALSGSLWYPIALWITALPCAWAGSMPVGASDVP